MYRGVSPSSSHWSVYPSAWAAFLAGPIAWCANLESVYAFTPQACASGDRLALHLSTLLCLVAALLGGFFAWGNWLWLGRGLPTEGEGGTNTGARLLSVFGLIFGPSFALLIVSQWIAILMLDPCSP